MTLSGRVVIARTVGAWAVHLDGASALVNARASYWAALAARARSALRDLYGGR